MRLIGDETLRLLVFAECNTEKTLARLLFSDIKECKLKHRGGLTLTLRGLDETVERESDNEYDLIGMICDLERGTIMEVSVRKVLDKYFRNSDRNVVAGCDRGGIYLYKRGKLFAIVFDPNFEEALSCLSEDFHAFYDKYKSRVKRGKFQNKLVKAMLSDEVILKAVSIIRTMLIGG